MLSPINGFSVSKRAEDGKHLLRSYRSPILVNALRGRFMPLQLTRGTKETIEVSVTDQTQTVTDLSSAGAHFDVEDDVGTKIVDNAAATALGMVISCLCDTTGWPSTLQHANLYAKFTVGPETPRLGPFDLYLIGQ